MQTTTNKTLINRKKLLAMIPLSERTIFNMERRGEFPRRIALTSRNVAWDLAEVEEWIEARKSSGTQAMRPGFAPVVVAGSVAAAFSG
ncbi:helix-turn-helix transcriptional regulator [Xanthomonas phaseoli]|uniref:helix-turn-helix transcriptional regulator n=1 Tax=Xanthomonas phaseoli TaxID=1985254 RepID=UPI000301AC86|nr:AlpA family phage regulatory protein [Xanthomonas phaseoli]